jgi:hypothetical protein
MKVKDLIRQLQGDYDPSEEIAIAYWDRDFVSKYIDAPIPYEDWKKIVAEYEAGEWWFQSLAMETLEDITKEQLNNDE